MFEGEFVFWLVDDLVWVLFEKFVSWVDYFGFDLDVEIGVLFGGFLGEI